MKTTILLNEIGITKFNDIKIYEKALTHSSYAHENNIDSNERLEFLGDAVLEVLMSDYLFKDPKLDEGDMTKKRAQAVCEDALVQYATKINLVKYLNLGKGEIAKGANNAMISDTFEALFGAIYLDLGFDKTKEVFNKLIIPNMVLVSDIKDYKTLLQELIQVDKRTLVYSIINETGPSHDKKFKAVVKLESIILGTGSGKTKKEAEQFAAKEALEREPNYAKKTL